METQNGRTWFIASSDGKTDSGKKSGALRESALRNQGILPHPRAPPDEKRIDGEPW